MDGSGWLELYGSWSALSRCYGAVGDYENAKRCLFKTAASILERNVTRLFADTIQEIAKIDAEAGNKDVAEVLDAFARELASVGRKVYLRQPVVYQEAPG